MEEARAQMVEQGRFGTYPSGTHIPAKEMSRGQTVMSALMARAEEDGDSAWDMEEGKGDSRLTVQWKPRESKSRGRRSRQRSPRWPQPGIFGTRAG